MSRSKKPSSSSPAKKKPAAVPVFTVEPETMPKHCVVGDQFVAQTDQGELRISLRIREGLMRQMEGAPVAEQFELLLTSHAPDWVERLDELDTTDVAILRTMFFFAFSQWQGARLGEALGSST